MIIGINKIIACHVFSVLFGACNDRGILRCYGSEWFNVWVSPNHLWCRCYVVVHLLATVGRNVTFYVTYWERNIDIDVITGATFEVIYCHYKLSTSYPQTYPQDISLIVKGNSDLSTGNPKRCSTVIHRCSTVIHKIRDEALSYPQVINKQIRHFRATLKSVSDRNPRIPGMTRPPRAKQSAGKYDTIGSPLPLLYHQLLFNHLFIPSQHDKSNPEVA